MAKKVVIIGSGIAGLSTAIRLANSGYDVTVYEANEYFGGKISWIKQDGYQWGFGASLLTLPHLIDELFEACGKNPADYYRYHRLDPVTRYFFSDGTLIDAHADIHHFAQEIATKTADTAPTILAYLAQIKRNFELTATTFLQKSLHKIRTYLSREALSIALFSPTRLGLFRSIHKKNSTFFKDPKTIQLFDRYATYNGSNPFRAPSILNLIAHPEFNDGAYILEDGMPSLTEALVKLAKELCVQLIANAPVQKILTENNVAKGVVVNGKEVYCDIVVSNMDITFTYQQLLKQHAIPKKIIKQEKSSSAMIFYWGMSRTFEELDVHNIIFGSDYAEEFRRLEVGEMSDDPTIYIFVSAKINKNHAKPNGENWFVLLNVPHNSGQDWVNIANKYQQKAQEKISQILGIDIAPYIETAVVNDPISIEKITRSHAGALYGSSSNKMMSAFQRHPNFSRKIKHLYFCGGSVHPGGGVPICILSGKITAQLIVESN
ncbi:MAG: phytoene desaturase [Chitinophagales bacterium]|nr:phytoene desaturase [Chitinophagales bacterium]